MVKLDGILAKMNHEFKETEADKKIHFFASDFRKDVKINIILNNAMNTRTVEYLIKTGHVRPEDIVTYNSRLSLIKALGYLKKMNTMLSKKERTKLCKDKKIKQIVFTDSSRATFHRLTSKGEVRNTKLCNALAVGYVVFDARTGALDTSSSKISQVKSIQKGERDALNFAINDYGKKSGYKKEEILYVTEDVVTIKDVVSSSKIKRKVVKAHSGNIGNNWVDCMVRAERSMVTNEQRVINARTRII